MKVYVVSYGWFNNIEGSRPMTPRVFYSDTGPNGAKAFVDGWMKDCNTMRFSTPFAFYDEVEVE